MTVAEGVLEGRRKMGEKGKRKEGGEGSDSGLATEEEEEEEEVVLSREDERPVARQMVWGNVAKFVILHSLALWGLTLLPSLSLASWLWLLLTYQVRWARQKKSRANLEVGANT